MKRLLVINPNTSERVSALLQTPKPKVSIKSSDLTTVEYEMSAFVGAGSSSSEVRNQLFDLAHRHLQAFSLQRFAIFGRMRFHQG